MYNILNSNFFKKILRLNKPFANVVVAKVIKIEKHPNADRLRIVTLDVGKNLIEPVICGANNFKEGDAVALALPGAKIAQNIYSETHEPFVLEKAKIRGIESQGMICASFELGLSKKPGHGIMILKSSSKLGTELKENMIDTY